MWTLSNRRSASKPPGSWGIWITARPSVRLGARKERASSAAKDYYGYEQLAFK
jgi:hypothetical protein